jgi:hypothetical protein
MNADITPKYDCRSRGCWERFGHGSFAAQPLVMTFVQACQTISTARYGTVNPGQMPNVRAATKGDVIIPEQRAQKSLWKSRMMTMCKVVLSTIGKVRQA